MRICRYCTTRQSFPATAQPETQLEERGRKGAYIRWEKRKNQGFSRPSVMYACVYVGWHVRSRDAVETRQPRICIRLLVSTIPARLDRGLLHLDQGQAGSAGSWTSGKREQGETGQNMAGRDRTAPPLCLTVRYVQLMHRRGHPAGLGPPFGSLPITIESRRQKGAKPSQASTGTSSESVRSSPASERSKSDYAG